jgi:hypothetical protein
MLRLILTALCLALLVSTAAAGQGAARDDRDGDGHRSTAAGGDDCDDNDANRFPGNVEVGDFDNHDEDCDPMTFGVLDEDGDGFTSSLVCNIWEDGRRSCGRDCDDSRASVHPLQIDICNLRDDNCNGELDEDQLCTALQGFMDRAGAEYAAIERAARLAPGQTQVAQPARDQPRGVQTMSEIARGLMGAQACANALRGRIAWNAAGDTNWRQSDINALCAGANNSAEPAACFDQVYHGGLARPGGGRQWTTQEAIRLCAGTRSASGTIACFENAVARGASTSGAINACAAR